MHAVQSARASPPCLPSSCPLRALLASLACLSAVEAYVVTVKDAAAPDSRGLLQPLLKRYQAKRCSYAVFALPAVHAVITFK